MTMRRILLTVGGLLLLSAGGLSAQAMKVTCKDGTPSKGGQGACSSHGGIATQTTAKADAKVAKTKFGSMPHFTKAHTGHIDLQDHGDEVSYRNIKIRELK